MYERLEEFIKGLRKENIKTWFDLGIFLDRFREERPSAPAKFKGSFSQYKQLLRKGGVAFISFHYSVDGVTIEVEKYAQTFRNLLPDIPIHYIAGEFYPEAYRLIHPDTKCLELAEIRGFDKWPLYRDFFFTKLHRGSKEYNQLILDYWEEVLQIIRLIGTYILKHNIRLLYLVNTNSNPGNVSMSLATALLSDGLGIPVINNNHDFYWEGGNNPQERKNKALPRGPRDFFFKNYDIGEFFSLIEVLFPWESRSWINVNINRGQSKHLIHKKGHNPANVAEIGTALDTHRYVSVTKRNNIESFQHLEAMLGGYEKKVRVHSALEVLTGRILEEEKYKPVIIGYKKKKKFDCVGDNIVLLQPTRIMPRKRIETDFNLIKRLFDNPGFASKFLSNPKLKLTLLISGPVPLGQHKYFFKLLATFSGWLETLPEIFRKRVFLAFLFSEFDKKRFREATGGSLDMAHIYNIASMVLLPSETEGRGLPIIEAAACGLPIFCRRYYPVNVYAEVIGELLEEKDRLKVLEYDGRTITEKILRQITDRIFFPQNYIKESLHNQAVVQKRFSLQSLKDNLENILRRLHHQQASSDSQEFLDKTIIRYEKTLKKSSRELRSIMNTENRIYMPGYGKLGFMLQLKSLIDPSYFRIEEQQSKGMAMRFAQKLVRETPNDKLIAEKTLLKFYNTVDNIFRHRKGEVKIRHDHSFSYRHRNQYFYPYHNFTAQERSGLINMLFHDIIQPEGRKKLPVNPHFFTDWNLSLFQMTNSSSLMIDDRKRLIKYLRTNVPIAYFPGEYIQQEMENFVLQPIRSRLQLPITKELTEDVLNDRMKEISPVYIFCPVKALGKWFTYDDLDNYLGSSAERELKLLYEKGIVQLVKTNQWTIGIHFAQLGTAALGILKEVKDKNGFLISYGDNPAIMTDIVDIDRFHIGKVDKEIAAHIMGIPYNSGFIQFVPAGVRTCLAYPTPIQTSYDFHELLKSRQFKKVRKAIGEKEIFATLRKDAETQGSPAMSVLDTLSTSSKSEKKITPVNYKYLSGVYKDGMPWSGVLARANTSKRNGLNWKFVVEASNGGPKKVTDFVNDIASTKKVKPAIAWNGGYILNAELVGKLGIPESYIGSPLGLIISDGKVISPPLYNKPALLIDNEGNLTISRVNATNGISVSEGDNCFNFCAQSCNPNKPIDQATYYDLMYPGESIREKGKVLVRLAGNTIKEIIPTYSTRDIKILPVGLTLAIPEDEFPKSWKEGTALNIALNQWQEINYGIEAGPLLVSEGRSCLDMQIEGWKTANSIATQAARLDYTDMRGPKIAVGLNDKNDLYILAINGRIRESVGATHQDMADIMIKHGMSMAMGFDPGGSSTLVVGDKTLNISPYNPHFEEDVYSLPPVPRGVSNAVIGWVK